MSQYFSYDAFGQPRILLGDVTNRGFTDHEHLSESGLIHMNGRVYDPLVSRFLSADPIVQAPEFSQSYNRYSYVWNSPLSLVDLSGYEARAYISDGVRTIECDFNIQLMDDITVEEREKYLLSAADILSQKDVKFIIKDDASAKINLILRRTSWLVELSNGKTITVGGNAGIIAETQKGPNIEACLNARSIAHEIAHRTGLPHLWDYERLVSNDENNINNLMNTYLNIIKPLRSTSGWDLTPEQSDFMYNVVLYQQSPEE